MQTEETACSGRNWGSADIAASTLTFQVGNKTAFRIPLRDVGQVQQVYTCHHGHRHVEKRMLKSKFPCFIRVEMKLHWISQLMTRLEGSGRMH